MSKALLLINIGTPDYPDKKSVKRFLKEFLNDKYVIDIPWLLRKILVNLIIIPFRVGKSTKLYQFLWTDKGSPLLYYQNNLTHKLNIELEGKYKVYSAMRYGNPTITKALCAIKKQGHDEVKILPLYPQYATSTTLSTIKQVELIAKEYKLETKLSFIEQFYNKPAFIKAYAQNINKYKPHSYDHVVFSYHGLPLRQIEKLHPQFSGAQCICEKQMPHYGNKCYKATCYQTTRLLAHECNIEEKNYSVSFQSRMSNNWLTPFTDNKLQELLNNGKKNILIVTPSFVADCLETIVEITHEYELNFKKAGGERLTLVPCLNDSNHWAKAISNIIS